MTRLCVCVMMGGIGSGGSVDAIPYNNHVGAGGGSTSHRIGIGIEMMAASVRVMQPHSTQCRKSERLLAYASSSRQQTHTQHREASC